MLDGFFSDNFQWANFSLQHLINFVVFASLGVVIIIYGKTLKEEQQWSYWLKLCTAILLVQYFKVLITICLGTFDYKTDLPLELCNMLPIFMIIMIYKRNRKWWGILFFWIMAGTFQATITPTLKHAFPHYEYWRYWIVHMFLTFAAIYGIYVFKFWPTIKDAWNSFIWLNVVAWSMFVINLLIGSNYMYMQGKPPGKTIYDTLGDWPIYLLQMQVLLWVLFFIVLLPFLIYGHFRRMKI